MDDQHTATKEPLAGARSALKSLAAISTGDLSSAAALLLDDLDRTGLGIGVCGEYLAALRSQTACALIALSCRRSESLVELRSRERLVDRAQGRLDDWSTVFVRLALASDRQRLSASGLSVRLGSLSDGDGGDLEAAIASYAERRRTSTTR